MAHNKIETISGAVSTFVRRKNSACGNPQWLIALHNGFAGVTKANAGFAYSITGREELLILSYYVTPKGKTVICDIH